MKKYLIPCALALSFTTTAHADKLGFEIGVNAWHTKQEITKKGADKDKTKSEFNGGLYAEFEHFVPFLPNIRAEYLQNKNDIRHSKTRSDASYTDITLYYQLLDNWVNLDLGLSARRMDAEFKGDGAKGKADSTLGALYSRLQFDLPASGLALGASIAHDTGVSSSKGLQDYQAYLRYQGLGGFGFYTGYRVQRYKLKYDHGMGKSKLNLDGAFVQAFWKF